MKRKLQLQFRKSYCFERLKERFYILDNDRIVYKYRGSQVVLKTRSYFRLVDEQFSVLFQSNGVEKNYKGYSLIKALLDALEYSQCRDVIEEIDEIIRILVNNFDEGKKDLIYEIPALIKKIAHKKYKGLFYQYIDKIKSLDISLLELIKSELYSIEELAEKRFNG